MISEELLGHVQKFNVFMNRANDLRTELKPLSLRIEKKLLDSMTNFALKEMKTHVKGVMNSLDRLTRNDLENVKKSEEDRETIRKVMIERTLEGSEERAYKNALVERTVIPITEKINEYNQCIVAMKEIREVGQVFSDTEVANDHQQEEIMELVL